MFKRMTLAAASIAAAITLTAAPALADNAPNVDPPVFHQPTCADHATGSVSINWTAGYTFKLQTSPGGVFESVDPGEYAVSAPAAVTVEALASDGTVAGTWSSNLVPATGCPVAPQVRARFYGGCRNWAVAYWVKPTELWQTAPPVTVEYDVNWNPRRITSLRPGETRWAFGHFRHDGRRLVQVYADDQLVASRTFLCGAR